LESLKISPTENIDFVKVMQIGVVLSDIIMLRATTTFISNAGC